MLSASSGGPGSGSGDAPAALPTPQPAPPGGQCPLLWPVCFPHPDRSGHTSLSPQPCQGRPVTQTVGGHSPGTGAALPISGCPPRGARSDLGRLLRALGVRRLPCEAWLAELRVRAVGLPHELSSLMRRRHTDPPLTHPRVADTSPGPARRAGCQPAPAPGHQGAPGTFPVTLRESWPRLGSPASLSPGSSVATQEAAQQRCPGAPGAGCQHQPGCPGG